MIPGPDPVDRAEARPDAGGPPPARTLVFVLRRADVPRQRPLTDVVVADTAWTPPPGERPDLIPIRPAIVAAVARHNLFDESLARLDEWAAAAGLADRFESGGVTWWLHARGFIRLVVHELLLWHAVIAELAPAGRYDALVVTADRPSLVAAARAIGGARGGPRVIVRGGPSLPRRIAFRTWKRIRPTVANTYRRTTSLFDPRVRRRAAILRARTADLAARPGAVLAVMRAASFHTVRSGGVVHRGDPYVGPVLARLEDGGMPVIRVILGTSHRRTADWKDFAGDDTALPWSFVWDRWAARRDKGWERDVEARFRGIGEVPLVVDGAALGPPLREAVAAQVRWFVYQARQMTAVEGLMAELAPGVLFTGWEAARTAWLGAARRRGVPIVAIQHGVIYPNTPDYVRPEHPGLVRPDVTCVFGPYVRDLLVEHGGFAPDAVVVTGSPRATPASALAGRTVEERTAVRRRVGVADGNRLLVFSAARHSVGDEFHSMAMAGRLLGGPFPGIHIVFKLHPEERSGDHYLELLRGLAAAGGYEAPAMSVIRDIDVYRLLRTADAHLGQYSTVLTDAVMTATPNLIAVGQAWSDIIGYVQSGVATPVSSVEDVVACLADPRPPDPEARRRFLEAHTRDGDAVGRVAAIVAGAAVGARNPAGDRVAEGAAR